MCEKHNERFSGDAVYGWVIMRLCVHLHRRHFLDGGAGFLKALVWPAFLVYEVFRL